MKKYEYQGRKLKECRKALGINGTVVGAACGVSQSAYSKWEQGQQEVPRKRRDALAQALNTTWMYISLGREDGDLEDGVVAEEMTSFNLSPPLATEFAFQCGQMLANVQTMASQWRANRHLLDGLRPEYQERLTRIFEAAL